MLTEDREHHFIRLIFMALFWVFLRISIVVTGVIALIQWVSMWFQDGPSQPLLNFSKQLSIFQRQITEYLTFQTEAKVFPFSDWPELPVSEEFNAEDSAEVVADINAEASGESTEAEKTDKTE
jgi:hypothetical protein